MVRTNEKVPAKVRDVPQDLVQRGREIWLAGLGAVATVEEEGSSMFETLVKRGRRVEATGRKQLGAVREEVDDRRRELVEAVEENVYEPLVDGLKRFGVPTRSEMAGLSGRVDSLARKVDVLLARLESVEVPAEGVAVFSVVANPDGDGWLVRAERGDAPATEHATKEDALARARALANEARPSRLRVFKRDGRIQDTFSYGG